MHNPAEKRLYPIYAILAFVYRIFITWGIFFILQDAFYLLGFILACGLVFMWFGLPLLKGGWWLMQSSELAGQRYSTQARFLLFLGIILFLFFAVPVEDAVVVQGVVEGRHLQHIYADTEGVLAEFAPTDVHVHKGKTLLARIENPGLIAELESLRLGEVIVDARMNLAKAVGQEDIAWQHYLELTGVQQQRLLQATTVAKLAILAPMEGFWIAPKLPRKAGKWIARGDMLGSIFDPSQLRLRVIVDQFDAARIFAESLRGARFVVSERPDMAEKGDFVATIEGKPAPAGRKELFHPSLSQQAGGNTAVNQGTDGKLITQSHIFEMRLLPEAAALPLLYPGQRVDARLIFGSQPLGMQWLRRLRQAFRDI